MRTKSAQLSTLSGKRSNIKIIIWVFPQLLFLSYFYSWRSDKRCHLVMSCSLFVLLEVARQGGKIIQATALGDTIYVPQWLSPISEYTFSFQIRKEQIGSSNQEGNYVLTAEISPKMRDKIKSQCCQMSLLAIRLWWMTWHITFFPFLHGFFF